MIPVVNVIDGKASEARATCKCCKRKLNWRVWESFELWAPLDGVLGSGTPNKNFQALNRI